MQRYWINQNGIQSGPHTIEELKQMTFDPSATYVWRSGMPDWKRIDELDELKGIVNLVQAPSQPDPQPAEATAASNGDVQPEQEPEQEQEQEPEQAGDSETAEQPHDDTPAAQPPVYHEPAVEPQYQAMPPQYEPQQYVPRYAPGTPECPPTNLVWAIVCIVLCCWIPAVVALIFSLQVKTKYRMGDYAAAQKYSDWSAWLCIISIVLGIVSTPIVLLTQALAQ